MLRFSRRPPSIIFLDEMRTLALLFSTAGQHAAHGFTSPNQKYSRITSKLLKPNHPRPPLPRSMSQHQISEFVDDITEWLTELDGRGPPVLLTGAGVSVDSGIPDYRGNNGR